MDRTTLHANGLEFPALAEGSGPVVFCLHGFPDHPRSFREQLPALAAAGYRAIAPTMRGYDPACQPADGDYHLVRMAEDVVGWIDDLGAERVHLVGHDWGAATAYTVGAMAPERLRSLTTIALPHTGRFLREAVFRLPGQALKSWYILFFQLRGIADRRVRADDWAFLERLWRDWSPGWAWPPEEMKALKETFAKPGVLEAALAYYRALPDLFSPAGRKTFRLSAEPIRVATLAITGELDGCLDARLHDLLMRESDFPNGVEIARFEGAGHFVHQEKPREVNARILGWLAGKETP